MSDAAIISSPPEAPRDQASRLREMVGSVQREPLVSMGVIERLVDGRVVVWVDPKMIDGGVMSDYAVAGVDFHRLGSLGDRLVRVVAGTAVFINFTAAEFEQIKRFNDIQNASLMPPGWGGRA